MIAVLETVYGLHRSGRRASEKKKIIFEDLLFCLYCDSSVCEWEAGVS